MPELPEIETVKLQLQPVLTGQTLESVELISHKSVQGHLDGFIRHSVEQVRRKAKVLLIDFNGGLTMAFHFKMTGQLVYIIGNKRIAGGHPTEDFVGQLPSNHT